MKVISKEPIRVATLSGAIVFFEAGVPVEISEEIGLIALQMGAEEVTGGSKEPEAEEETEVKETEVEPEEPVLSEQFDAELDTALCKLMDEGDPDNFTADGYPKAAVVNKIMGKTVNSDTRKAAWDNILNS